MWEDGSSGNVFSCQVPLVAGTVNRGSNQISSGLIVNDWIAFTGFNSTATEISVIEKVFKLSDSFVPTPANGVSTAAAANAEGDMKTPSQTDFKDALIDSLF